MDNLNTFIDQLIQKARTLALRLEDYWLSIPSQTMRAIKWSMVSFCVLIILLALSSIWFYQALVGPGRLLVDGHNAFWRSHFAEAERVYKRVLSTARMRPQQTEAYIGLCRLYTYQEKFPEALEACQAAVQSDGESAWDGQFSHFPHPGSGCHRHRNRIDDCGNRCRVAEDSTLDQ